jgi:hypothetical protein
MKSVGGAFKSLAFNDRSSQLQHVAAQSGQPSNYVLHIAISQCVRPLPITECARPKAPHQTPPRTSA